MIHDKKKFRVTVSCAPDERSRIIRVSSKEKITREEFLIELIDYIERQTDVTDEMILGNNIPGGDPEVYH
jgi:hypothetical protein